MEEQWSANAYDAGCGVFANGIGGVEEIFHCQEDVAGCREW
jgi:hypothetical protein